MGHYHYRRRGGPGRHTSFAPVFDPPGDSECTGFRRWGIALLLDPASVPEERLVRVRRTYEPSRLIELTAIAIAGIGLHLAGGHEILDVAVRGSAADYLVDEARHHLEIAGRSRRSDMETAWQQKWRRLEDAQEGGCYVCVAEFESPAGRLAFAD